MRRQGAFADELGRHSETGVGSAQQARLLIARKEDEGHVQRSAPEPYVIENDARSKETGSVEVRAHAEVSAVVEAPCRHCSSLKLSAQTAKKFSPRTNPGNDQRDVFLLDSGASDHMVLRKDLLRGCEKIDPRDIVLGDGKRVFATHRGSLVLKTRLSFGNDYYCSIPTSARGGY